MKLENFVGMMTGHFDNKDQFNKMQNLKNLLQHFIMKRTESGKAAAQASSLR